MRLGDLSDRQSEGGCGTGLHDLSGPGSAFHCNLDLPDLRLGCLWFLGEGLKDKGCDRSLISNEK